MDQASRPEQIEALPGQPNQWNCSCDNADGMTIGCHHSLMESDDHVPSQIGNEALIAESLLPEDSSNHLDDKGGVGQSRDSNATESDATESDTIESDTTESDTTESDTTESVSPIIGLKVSSHKRDGAKPTVSKFRDVALESPDNLDSRAKETAANPWGYQCLISCTRCAENKQYAFRFPKVMARHKHIQNKGINIHCTVCKSITQATAKIDSVGNNINDQDILPKPILACDMCTTVEFDDLLDWALHDKKHIKDPHKCLTCGAVSPNRFGLKRHILRMHAPKKLCEICGVFYTYDNHYQIAGHADKYQCSQCGEEFTRQIYLTRHVRRYHEFLKPHSKRDYLCNICGKKFVVSSSFYEHKQQHKLGKLKCDMCGKEYFNGSSLKRHQKAHHVNDRIKYHCKYCGKQFVSEQGMEIHEQNQHANHDGRPVYSCDHCGKKFKSKNGLKIHSRNHERLS